MSGVCAFKSTLKRTGPRWLLCCACYNSVFSPDVYPLKEQTAVSLNMPKFAVQGNPCAVILMCFSHE